MAENDKFWLCPHCGGRGVGAGDTCLCHRPGCDYLIEMLQVEFRVYNYLGHVEWRAYEYDRLRRGGIWPRENQAQALEEAYAAGFEQGRLDEREDSRERARQEVFRAVGAINWHPEEGS
jgi:hypothetical protein